MGSYINKLLLVLCVFNACYATASFVRYDLIVNSGRTNPIGGESVDFSIKINDSSPAPALKFKEGDYAELYVENRLDKSVLLQIYGHLDTEKSKGFNEPMRVLEKQTKIFRFPIMLHGTYWYRISAGSGPEQDTEGAIVVKAKNEPPNTLSAEDVIAVFSDWSTEDPEQIARNLHKDIDYYLYQKGTVKSWYDALKTGNAQEYWTDLWTRSGTNNLSEVYYDAYLVNASRDIQISEAKPSEKVRIRLINASSSTNFHISLGTNLFSIIAVDGQDIEPIETKSFELGIGETSDILFEPPESKNYELRAYAQDFSSYASAWIGVGRKVSAQDKTAPSIYSSSKYKHLNANALSDLDLKSVVPPNWDPNLPEKKYDLVLDGNLKKYSWKISPKDFTDKKFLDVKYGELVRLDIKNISSQPHTIHLEGHLFRVLGSDTFSSSSQFKPLISTVNIRPGESRSIEFLANKPGRWQLVCNDLYHQNAGMNLWIQYSDQETKLIPLNSFDQSTPEKIYLAGQVLIANSLWETDFRLIEPQYVVELNFENSSLKKTDKFKWSSLYRHLQSRYFNYILGVVHDESLTHDMNRAVAGVSYLFPLFIYSDLVLDHKGDIKAEIKKKITWSRNYYTLLESHIASGTKAEFRGSLMFSTNWHFAIGIFLRDHETSGAVSYRF